MQLLQQRAILFAESLQLALHLQHLLLQLLDLLLLRRFRRVRPRGAAGQQRPAEKERRAALRRGADTLYER
jgi:hypothetical protein